VDGDELPILRLTIRLPVRREDLAGLSDRLAPRLAAAAPAVAVCEFSGTGEADLAAVDALARLGLLARRHGCRLRLRSCPLCVAELVALAGLGDVLER
jgi:ABC-type transporter Mla MlaB component